MLNESDQEQFTRAWTEAQPSVSRHVLSVVRNDATSKDILQATALVLLKKFEEYDSSQPFLPWALGIANFQILGFQRDTARSRVSFDSELLDRYTESWASTDTGDFSRGFFPPGLPSGNRRQSSGTCANAISRRLRLQGDAQIRSTFATSLLACRRSI